MIKLSRARRSELQQSAAPEEGLAGLLRRRARISLPAVVLLKSANQHASPAARSGVARLALAGATRRGLSGRESDLSLGAVAYHSGEQRKRERERARNRCATLAAWAKLKLTPAGSVRVRASSSSDNFIIRTACSLARSPVCGVAQVRSAGEAPVHWLQGGALARRWPVSCALDCEFINHSIAGPSWLAGAYPLDTRMEAPAA